jgi:hypothetical protein
MNTLAGERPGQEIHESGELAGELVGAGSIFCVECGYALSLAALDALPHCPACGGSRFRRASMFEQQPTVDADAVEAAPQEPPWLAELRGELEAPGRYLAFDDDGETRVTKLEEGWIRIGRSGSADVRLDDPTVSRRHALVVLTSDNGLRAMDDRSLNGLFVNGERIDWAELSDGDELEIGRFRLYVIEA